LLAAAKNTLRGVSTRVCASSAAVSTSTASLRPPRENGTALILY
jgi:hypothetical protein